MMPRTGSCLLFVLLSAQLGWSADKPEEAATKSAQAWLALVDQGKYLESWDSAAKLFQNAMPREKWKEALSGVRPPLGKLVSRSVKSADYKTALPGVPDGKYVVIQFSSSFENKKEAVETVTPMQGADGTWKVAGYFIK
jgi:hypothetical protein